MKTRITCLALLLLLGGAIQSGEYAKPPNIIWLVAEDISPNLGCYGDPAAVTPHLDRFAAQGVRFERAFSHTPVCAPSRSGLITGMYPTAIGSHHMRSKLKKPPEPFTVALQKSGYHVAWPGKTDFNFDVPPKTFSRTTEWLKNPPPEPFFAYMNFNVTHESQIRAPEDKYRQNTAKLKPEHRHDPAKMTLPPYYPDAPEVRRDVARYHDNITAMDIQVGAVLAEIDRRGWSENSIVFFFGDHGWGMSRGKRWLYDSGLRVPLLIRWPGKLAPGTVRDDLVAFVDFAPTVLEIAGAEIAPRLQGQIFLGEKARKREYIYGHRDRMDETYDRIRCVRSNRYKYIRNFHPELPYAQQIEYMDEMPTMKVWRKFAADGKLVGPQSLFFAKTKPKEELYDLDRDPHEVENLVDQPEFAMLLAEHRMALDRWISDTGDLGQFTERELIQKGLVEDVLKQYDERIKRRPKP